MDTAAEALDLDIGNTRTKWRCGTRTGILAAPGLPTLPRRPARVRIATVRGDREALAAAARRRYGVAAEFATVAPALGGVRCGYCRPERLGIDRWLGVVAAWGQVHAAAAVIGAGTAATFDYVAADGRHQGGCIAPGLALMRMALRQGTADGGLRGAAGAPAPSLNGCGTGGGPPAPLGRSTAAAVAAGTSTMLAGFAQAALAGCPASDAAVFVTGGDAPLLTTALASTWPGPVRHVPTLVLDGLAIALP